MEGMDRTLSNPHQDEIDAVGTFFEVEQQLAALQASPSQVPMIQPVCRSPENHARSIAVLDGWATT